MTSLARGLLPAAVAAALLDWGCVAEVDVEGPRSDPCAGASCDSPLSHAGQAGQAGEVEQVGQGGEDQLGAPEVILLSGYGPFSGYEINPSWEAVRALDGERFGRYEVHALSLPVVWDEAPALLLAEVEDLDPAMVISAGVAGGRPEAFSLERVAWNEEWGTDVEGNRRRGEAVVEGGPDRLESTLPLDRIAEALTEAEVSWEWSDDAGRYLCNHLFYSEVHAMSERDVPAGFIHVSDRNASVEELAEGFRVLVSAVAEIEAAP